MQDFNDTDLKSIFAKISEKIDELDTGDKIMAGHFDLDQITKSWIDATDDGIFENMAVCIFVGGMKIKILETKWQAMREAFRNFKIDYVASLNVDALVKNENIVRHRKKLSALIQNAKRIQEIQQREGSLKNYLSSRLGTSYDCLLKNVISDFDYLGPATGADFLKDIGMGGYKPDIHVTRILSRLGLYDGNLTTLSMLFERITHLTGLTAPDVDRMLFRYGSGHKLQHAVCGTEPLCRDCLVLKCEFGQRP